MPGGIATTTTGAIFMNMLYLPIIGLFIYLELSWESMTILAALLVIDYITGVAKVYVIDKNQLKSYKAIAGIISKVSILLIPIVLSIAAKQIGYDMKVFTDSVITMLVLSETYSIIGNIRSIQLKKRVEEIDAVSLVLGKITRLIETLLKKD